MSSPVEKIISSIIQIDRKSPKPVYLQCANEIADAIKKKLMPSASRLPGTRQLGKLLNIHRKTAVAVYNELADQGFIEIIPNKGTFVTESGWVDADSHNTAHENKFDKTPEFEFRKSNILDNPFEFSSCEFALNDGIPDVRLFQTTLLSRYYSANLKRRQNQKKIGYFNYDGSEYFKHHFTNYLNETRALNITKENLLITRSTEMTVFILSELLLSYGDTVVVGNPSYFAMNMIFQKSGAEIRTIPVDQEGLDVEMLEELCQSTAVRMVYVAPHNHYPTTVVLAEARRKKLLQLASQYGFIIIEDDYDYDFQYEVKNVLPLASRDTSGMAIYIGSFGKTLAPGFRTGFAVSSPEFISEMKKYLGIIDKQGDIVMEQALGEMIEEGEINRHLRKSLQVYRRRRDHFATLLHRFIGDEVSFAKPSGGMAYWLEWKKVANLAQIAQRCREKGLFIPRTLLYQNRNLCAMRLGFANFNEDEAGQILEIFASGLH